MAYFKDQNCRDFGLFSYKEVSTKFHSNIEISSCLYFICKKSYNFVTSIISKILGGVYVQRVNMSKLRRKLAEDY